MTPQDFSESDLPPIEIGFEPTTKDVVEKNTVKERLLRRRKELAVVFCGSLILIFLFGSYLFKKIDSQRREATNAHPIISYGLPAASPLANSVSPSAIKKVWVLHYNQEGADGTRVLSTPFGSKYNFYLWRNNLYFREFVQSGKYEYKEYLSVFDILKKEKHRIFDPQEQIESLLFSKKGIFLTFQIGMEGAGIMEKQGGALQFVDVSTSPPKVTPVKIALPKSGLGGFSPSIASVTKNVVLGDCGGDNGSWDCVYYKFDVSNRTLTKILSTHGFKDLGPGQSVTNTDFVGVDTQERFLYTTKTYSVDAEYKDNVESISAIPLDDLSQSKVLLRASGMPSLMDGVNLSQDRSHLVFVVKGGEEDSNVFKEYDLSTGKFSDLTSPQIHDQVMSDNNWYIDPFSISSIGIHDLPIKISTPTSEDVQTQVLPKGFEWRLEEISSTSAW